MMQPHISILKLKTLTIMMLDVSQLMEMMAGVGEGQDVEEGRLAVRDS